jgi:FkbM family methyltransferase
VFSDSARKAEIPQYIDNRQVYGYMVFKPDDIPHVADLIRSQFRKEDAFPSAPAINDKITSALIPNRLRLEDKIWELLGWRGLIENAPDDQEMKWFDFCLRNLGKTKSQNFQELFVLFELDQKTEGFFVEFGAGDGVYLSNSYMLEVDRGWRGILAEPAKSSFRRLRDARRCIIDDRCVWKESGAIMQFVEAGEPELSTMTQFIDADRHGAHRAAGSRYDVRTVSLTDLLTDHKAPRRIDYLSVDTEGSEFDILEAFDFDRFDVRVITVEHNYTAAREGIFQLLTSRGYERKFETFSRWDDWYVKRG